jgi:hypothetical protein
LSAIVSPIEAGLIHPLGPHGKFQSEYMADLPRFCGSAPPCLKAHVLAEIQILGSANQQLKSIVPQ